MHNVIGRKLYLDWDNLILSIEKYPKTKEMCEKCQLIDKKFSLFDIVNILDQKIEIYKGTPNNEQIGHEFSYYLTCNDFWATENEMKEIYRKQIYDARCNIKLLEKDFNFKLGYKLTKSEYDEVFNNGLQVKICSPSLDEVFFGSLYRNEDITAFKELDQEKIIYFVALNTTICGCLCGTVYSARINDQYALKMDK